MKFFRKSAPEKKETITLNKDCRPTITEPVKEQFTQPEQAARKWFSEQFNTDMPEEVMRMFRQIAQTEEKRQKIGTILDANELKRIQESIRLCQTKLLNVTQNLNSLQGQKEWYHKFKELNNALEKYRQAYFQSNKEYNAHLKDIKDLERFETFETIQDNYRHIKTKEALLQVLRKESASHAQLASEAQGICKDFQKQADTENKKYLDARHNLNQIQPLLAEGYHLQATLEVYETNIKGLTEYQALIKQALSEAEKEEKEERENWKRNQEKTAQQQLLRQNLESQQNMLEKGEVILVKLNFLQSQKKRKEQLQAILERTRKKQHEQDETMNRLFLSSQDINAQIKVLQSELQVHQKSIVGMSSYNLQQRTINLKSKKEMLENATRLWKQITEGYIRVDEKSQDIMRMKHHNDALKAQIEELEPETAGLQKQCEELQYAYTLSKSQDIIQLRKDLQEGVRCSVCGATHHSYHADTLLEQSKIIGDIKKELEQTATELKRKQALLADLYKERDFEEGRLDISFQTLEVYKKILQDHVEHWNIFESLDRSFKECSSSTNFNGRRIMLQQLMEKTGVDAEQAQKELDTFNYHQSNINSLNEQISKKEQEKENITIRLNEVNTGCQVLAFRVEQLQQSLSRTNGLYGELFEDIDHLMDISNWYKVWTENPENLKVYIQQQAEQWFNMKKDITETQIEQSRLQVRLESLQQYMQTLNQQHSLIYAKIEQITECKNQAHERLNKIFKDEDIKAGYQIVLDALHEAKTQKEETNSRVVEAEIQYAREQGYNRHISDVIQQIETQISEERSYLDIWIRKYNALHSPVQFSELESTFNSNNDWNSIRAELRELTVQNRIAEARAEEARIALTTHQVNGPRGQEKEDRTAALNTEIARLESERNKILTQMASLQAQLDSHETGLQKLAARE